MQNVLEGDKRQMGKVGEGIYQVSRTCNVLEKLQWHELCGVKRSFNFLMEWRKEQHILGGSRLCPFGRGEAFLEAFPTPLKFQILRTSWNSNLFPQVVPQDTFGIIPDHSVPKTEPDHLPLHKPPSYQGIDGGGMNLYFCLLAMY